MRVELLDYMGSDFKICSVARISFARKAEEFTPEQNERLINYLAKYGHWSPFSHVHVSLAMQAPIAIKAQCDKHTVGFASNTESRRYISHPPELFLPTFRTKPDGSVKQGSGGEHPDNDIIREAYHALAHECLELYNGMIAQGVAAEQARFILPQGVETNWVWTGSLYAWARFYNLRTDPHAQKEIRNLAYMVEDVIAPLYPISWKALTNQTEKTND